MTLSESSNVIERGYPKSHDCCSATPHIYSGLVSDFQILAYPVSCPCSGESGLGAILLYPLLLPLSIIDIPLSFAADTLVLPYTIHRQKKYGNIREACECDDL